MNFASMHHKVTRKLYVDSFAEIDEEALLNSLVQLQKFQSISIDNFSLPSLPPTPNSFRGIRGKTSSFRRWLVICSDDSTKYDNLHHRFQWFELLYFNLLISYVWLSVLGMGSIERWLISSESTWEISSLPAI